MKDLECIFCQKKYPLDLFRLFCPDCREPLLVKSPQPPTLIHSEKISSLERYLDFLPFDEIILDISLGEGNTPLLRLNRLRKEFDLPEVYAKNEMLNPTASFKDRGTITALQIALSMGIRKIGTVSTGNMAVSTAAYGARAGLDTYVLVSEGIWEEKLLPTGIHGATLVKVKGDYGELFYKSLEIGYKKQIYFMNSVDPFRIEGYKVTALEIVEQLKGNTPSHVFVPVSSGGHIIGLMKAFKELTLPQGRDKYPAFIGVQPEKASPIVKAFSQELPKYKRINKADSVAQSINNPAPPGGNIVLKMIRELNGRMITVSDSEILRAQSLLARREGLFCLPASAAALAGLLKYRKELSSHDQAVLILTGAGFKNLKALDFSKMKIIHTSLKKLDLTISSLVR